MALEIQYTTVASDVAPAISIDLTSKLSEGIRSLQELLGVNDGEIDFGYNSNSHTIFIYDTALGGAGYSPLLREYKDVLCLG